MLAVTNDTFVRPKTGVDMSGMAFVECSTERDASFRISDDVIVLGEAGDPGSTTVGLGLIDALAITPVTRSIRLVFVDPTDKSGAPTFRALRHCDDRAFGAVVDILRRRVSREAQQVRMFMGDETIVVARDHIDVVTWSFTGRGSSTERIARSSITEVDVTATGRKVRLRIEGNQLRTTLHLSGADEAHDLVRALTPGPQQLGKKARADIDKGRLAPPWEPPAPIDGAAIGPRDTSPRVRRIGRLGRSAPLVPFMSTTRGGWFFRILLGDGHPFRAGRLRVHGGTRLGEMVAMDDRGTPFVSVGDRRPRAPWAPRRVRSEVDGRELDVRVGVLGVWFRTSWVVEAPGGRRILTVTEPLRDGLTRRLVRGTARVLTNDGGNDILDTLILIVFAGLAWVVLAPVRLVKPHFRFIIRDESGRRVGVLEHRVQDFDPADSMVAWFDADALAQWDRSVLAAALLVPMVAVWA